MGSGVFRFGNCLEGHGEEVPEARVEEILPHEDCLQHLDGSEISALVYQGLVFGVNKHVPHEHRRQNLALKGLAFRVSG